MAQEIRMPKLGQTTEEVHLVRWLVAVGGSVRRGDPLCEVENDKTTMEMESFAEGTILRLLVPDGSTVNAGTAIAIIGQPDEKLLESPAEPGPAPDAASSSAGPTLDARLTPSGALPGGRRASRLVRNLAQKRGIDLASVHGTGPAGLITRKDLDSGGPAQLGPTRIPLSDHQLQVGRLMSASASSIPSFSLEATILCDRLLDLRERKKTAHGEKLSIDTLFISAVTAILSRMPRINSSFQDGNLYAHNEINIAFAVSAHDELFAPVIHAADRMDMEEIDRQVRWLAAKARNDKLERADITGATFTISNLGMYPVDSFQAIITPPQVAVVAIGRIRRIMDIDASSSFRIRPACTIWGSFDHRAVNGAQGAEFLQAVKQHIEEEI